MYPYKNPLHNYASNPSLETLDDIFSEVDAQYANGNYGVAYHILSQAVAATSFAQVGSPNLDQQNALFEDLTQKIFEKAIALANDSYFDQRPCTSFLEIVMQMTDGQDNPDYERQGLALESLARKFNAESYRITYEGTGNLVRLGEAAEAYANLIQYGVNSNKRGYGPDYEWRRDSFKIFAEQADAMALKIQEHPSSNPRILAQLSLPGLEWAQLSGAPVNGILQQVRRSLRQSLGV